MAVLNPRNLLEVAVKVRFRYAGSMGLPQVPMP